MCSLPQLLDFQLMANVMGVHGPVKCNVALNLRQAQDKTWTGSGCQQMAWSLSGLVVVLMAIKTFRNVSGIFWSEEGQMLFRHIQGSHNVLCWPLSMRPRQHDRIVLIGLCWLYGRSEFSPPPPLGSVWTQVRTNFAESFSRELQD